MHQRYYVEDAVVIILCPGDLGGPDLARSVQAVIGLIILHAGLPKNYPRFTLLGLALHCDTSMSSELCSDYLNYNIAQIPRS